MRNSLTVMLREEVPNKLPVGVRCRATAGMAAGITIDVDMYGAAGPITPWSDAFPKLFTDKRSIGVVEDDLIENFNLVARGLR